MEHVNCNICGHNDTKTLFRKNDKYLTTEDNFEIVECQNCGLIYLNPRPSKEEIYKFYPEIYNWKDPPVSTTLVSKYLSFFEKWYRIHLLKGEAQKVLSFTGGRKGKLLDVGCGAGDRLNIFRKMGFDTYGIEISLSPVEYARKYYKLNVDQGDIIERNYPDSFYDVITFYSVLGHTHDPKRIVKESCRILKKGGILVIQLPNIRCLQFKLFKKKWAGFDIPRDWHYFSDNILSRLLNEAGLDVIKIDYFSNWWHPPTLVRSMFPGLDPQMIWLDENRKKKTILRRLLWGILTLCVPPLVFLESLIARGALITVYAKKQ